MVSKNVIILAMWMLIDQVESQRMAHATDCSSERWVLHLKSKISPPSTKVWALAMVSWTLSTYASACEREDRRWRSDKKYPCILV